MDLHDLERQHLLEVNVDGVGQAYRDAVRNGHRDPVVLLLDVRDPAAEAAALALVDRDRLDDFRRAMDAEDLIPTLTVGLPYELARRALPAAVQAHLDAPSAGHLRVVVIAAGGNLYAWLPIPTGPAG